MEINANRLRARDSGQGRLRIKLLQPHLPSPHLTLISSISQPVPPSPIPPIPHNFFPHVFGKKPKKTEKTRATTSKICFLAFLVYSKTLGFYRTPRPLTVVYSKTFGFCRTPGLSRNVFSEFFLRFQSSFFKVFSLRAPMGGLLFQDSS